MQLAQLQLRFEDTPLLGWLTWQLWRLPWYLFWVPAASCSGNRHDLLVVSYWYL